MPVKKNFTVNATLQTPAKPKNQGPAGPTGLKAKNKPAIGPPEVIPQGEDKPRDP